MLGGWSMFVVGAVLIILGIVLRWDLVDWLIDFAGIILIILGVIALVIGLFNALTGGKKSSSSDW